MSHSPQPGILVTGATGGLGGSVARHLSRLGVPFRMLVRDASRAPRLPGATAVVGDYDDPASLRAAMHPGDRVLMLSLHASIGTRLRLHTNFIDAARLRDVSRVLYLSSINASPGAVFRHARSHGETERMLTDTGLRCGAVRMAMWAEQIGDWFDPDGRITGPGGDGRISLTSREEMGEAVAHLLAFPARDDRDVCSITTTEAVTLAELAAMCREVSGRHELRYEPLSREDWLEYRVALGRQRWSAEGGLTFYDGIAVGEHDVVTDDFQRIVGRPPTPLRDLLETFGDQLWTGVRAGGAIGAIED
ncbi:MAG: NAD(P)H-binding protein [Thermoleophilia bacterium]|nr:NAD(P)H-binding protein [Thermoleophilia bacterium]